jgi:hypothetical protein
VDVVDGVLAADEALEVLLDQLLEQPRALAQLALQVPHAALQRRQLAGLVECRQVRLGVEALGGGGDLPGRVRWGGA